MSNPLRNYRKYMLETTPIEGGWRHTIRYSSGTRIETWKKDRVLGIGSYGKVRLAKEEGGALRAVKKISKAKATGWSTPHELKAFTLLEDYPEHFVQFFGWWENAGNVYMAMEFIEGGNLGSFIRSMDVTEEDARNITRQLLEAVRILHKNKLCHRDLKPEASTLLPPSEDISYLPSKQNVLMGSLPPERITVKITDFGCSKQEVDTLLMSARGTPAYMAPEVLGYINSGTSVYTNKVDIWSLGCITYTIMTKEPPFEATRDYHAYLRDITKFPKLKLIANGTSLSGINFIISLMMPLPDDRLTPERALNDRWLCVVEGDPLEDGRNSTGPCTRDHGVNGQIISSPQGTPLPNELDKSLGKLRAGIEGSSSIRLNIPSWATYLSLLCLALSITVIYPGVYNSSEKHNSTSPTHTSTQQKDIYQKSHEVCAELLVWQSGCRTTEDLKKSLQLAVVREQIEAVGILLRGGVDPTTKIDGQSLLHWAVNHEKMPIIELLMRYGADSTSGDTFGMTPLHSAAQNGNMAILRYLLEHGANTDAKNNQGKTPLRIAVDKTDIAMVKCLVLSGADTMETDNTGQSILHTASQAAGELVVGLLVENGADISAVDNRGRTALHVAAISGNRKEMRPFLENRVDIMATNDTEQTILHMATKTRCQQIVRFLLEQGANVLAKDNRGRTALHLAAKSGSEHMVRLLIERGASVIAQENRGKTPLHLAITDGNEGMVNLLLESGANLLIVDHSGSQPLYTAIYGKEIVITRLLLQRGAVGATKDGGATAIAIAESTGQSRMKSLLVEYGAREGTSSGFYGRLIEGPAPGPAHGRAHLSISIIGVPEEGMHVSYSKKLWQWWARKFYSDPPFELYLDLFSEEGMYGNTARGEEDYDSE